MTGAALTPVELRAGRWYKREDAHSLPCGVNGAKLRACQYLIGRGREAGATVVVSAASILSPQNAMAAAVAAQYGMQAHIIVGGTRPETAFRQPSMQIAAELGGDFRVHPGGVQPVLTEGRRTAGAGVAGGVLAAVRDHHRG